MLLRNEKAIPFRVTIPNFTNKVERITIDNSGFWLIGTALDPVSSSVRHPVGLFRSGRPRQCLPSFLPSLLSVVWLVVLFRCREPPRLKREVVCLIPNSKFFNRYLGWWKKSRKSQQTQLGVQKNRQCIRLSVFAISHLCRYRESASVHHVVLEGVRKLAMFWPMEIKYRTWLYNASPIQKCNFHQNPMSSTFYTKIRSK